MRRARRRTNIEPYPRDLTRSIDLVDKLGLQVAVGANNLEVCFLRGRVSYQTRRLPPEVRRGGVLGESRIKIEPKGINQIEYEFGCVEPTDPSFRSQEEILRDIAEGLGLERAEEALAISIKGRVSRREVSDLHRELQNSEPLQGAEYLYHYEVSVGDHTSKINRSFGLPRGFLRSPSRFIRNELAEMGVVRRNDPILQRIRSVLRTNWIISDATGWSNLIPIMEQLHVELTKPFWWQDAAIPADILFRNGLIRPINAQLYRLYRRRYIVAIQLPEDTF